jgi:hypothetical protein
MKNFICYLIYILGLYINIITITYAEFNIMIIILTINLLLRITLIFLKLLNILIAITLN